MKLLDRRTVLRGLGGITVGLPLLEMMSCTPADAPTPAVARNVSALDPVHAARPRRLFIYCTPNGVVPAHYFPERSADGLRPATETDFALPTILAPLEPWRTQVTILDRVDNVSAPSGHENGQCSLLTGWRPTARENGLKLGEGISVDQRLGQALRARGHQQPELVLTLGTNNQGGWSGSLSYLGPQQPVAKIHRASVLWDRLFARFQPDVARAERIARRRSVLDAVLEDSARLEQRLGAADRARLEAHLETIRRVERRLSFEVPTCTSAPAAPSRSSLTDSTNLPQILEEFFEVLPVVFACDLARVVTMMVRTEGGQIRWTFPWLPWGSCPAMEGPMCVDSRSGAHSENHHEMSHYESSPIAGPRLVDANRWYIQALSRLVQRLHETREAESTLLENSLLVHTSGIARGNHSLQRMPFTTIGSLGGSVQGGRYLSRPGRTLNDAWRTVLAGFDVMDTSFGDPSLNTGLISGLLV